MSRKLDHYLQREAEDQPKEEPREEKKRLAYVPEPPENLPESVFIGIGYDGERHSAFIKLYEPNRKKIYYWYDNTNHKPYCFSDQPVEKLKENQSLMAHTGLDRLEAIRKYDALRDQEIEVTMIVARDPLSIGGRPVGCIRDIVKAWEADIKYVENFIYDRRLEPGMPYRISNGKLVAVKYEPPAEALRAVEEFLENEGEEYRDLAHEWIRLLECPVPEFRRVALDIEVYSPIATRLPDPREAEHPVICASLLGSDGKMRLLLLKRAGMKPEEELLEISVKPEYYEGEEKLLIELFKVLLDYPIVVTFNGDDFDLRYLWHRAQRLGFGVDQIPIELGREAASLKYGVHVDLYKFFFNRSIQIYAFGQKYREITLDEIGESLIGIGKKEIEVPVSDLNYSELATYCFRDSEIALKLTSFDDDLIMKLMTVLSRISYMTIEDVTRQGVSGWIRSMLYNEHRKRNYLIPRPDDILDLKGMTTTEAVIKGKKYKGAIVVEPVPGVHFNVAVLDFASLYPSIIKNWNLGYETIRCPHEDELCRNNTVPGTSHWVCKRRKALESLLIGSLRDLRVNWYKLRSKSEQVPANLRGWYKVVSDALKVVLNACFSGDTEVLTPHGKRRITDLRVGDEIYTLNEKSGAVEVKPIIECQHFVYNGPLVEISSLHVDWKVTANHELYVGQRIAQIGHERIRFSKRKALPEAYRSGRRYLFRHGPMNFAVNDEDSHEQVSLWPEVLRDEKLILIRANRPWERRFSPSSRFSHYAFTHKLTHSKVGRYYRNTRDVIDSIADSPSRFEKLYDCTLQVSNFEGHGRYGPWSFGSHAFFEMIGWYVTEGSLQIGGNKRGSRFARIVISQRSKHRANRKRMISTVTRLGLKPRVWRNAIAFSSRVVAEFLRDKCGTESHDKRLPDFVFTAPLQLRKILFETLMLGNGNLKRGYYSTVSRKLAEDFQHLAFTLGRESLIRTESLRSGSSVYRIKLYGRRHHTISSSNFGITPATGLDVYCVTAQDNHTIYAGRNGKFGWIGQSYGVFGADRFALYCPPVAEATAAIGRYAITKTIEKTKSLGVDVFYGDTDSIFLGSPNPRQLEQLVDWSRSSLGMELEVDKNYRYLALSSRKKNYLGVYPDGSVDIKGLTGKKRHVPQFLKKAFYMMVDILSQVKSEGEFEIAKQKIKAIVKDCYLKLKQRQYPLEELAFSVMISRSPEGYVKTTPQHVKAALLLAQKGIEVKPGDLIAFVKVVGEPGVKPVQLASPDEIDSRKYLEYIGSTFEQVLDALGTEFEELVGITKLESYFGSGEES